MDFCLTHSCSVRNIASLYEIRKTFSIVEKRQSGMRHEVLPSFRSFSKVSQQHTLGPMTKVRYENVVDLKCCVMLSLFLLECLVRTKKTKCYEII